MYQVLLNVMELKRETEFNRQFEWNFCMRGGKNYVQGTSCNSDRCS